MAPTSDILEFISSGNHSGVEHWSDHFMEQLSSACVIIRPVQTGTILQKHPKVCMPRQQKDARVAMLYFFFVKALIKGERQK